MKAVALLFSILRCTRVGDSVFTPFIYVTAPSSSARNFRLYTTLDSATPNSYKAIKGAITIICDMKSGGVINADRIAMTR